MNSLSNPKYRSKSSEALHEMAYDFISNPDPFKPHPVSKREMNPEAFMDAKTKFETASTEDLRYPQTGLTTRSTKTALGRYEAKIRSRSVGPVKEPPPEVLYAETEQPSLLQRNSEYSKSSPNLWKAYPPAEVKVKPYTPEEDENRSHRYNANREVPKKDVKNQYQPSPSRGKEVPRRDIKDQYELNRSENELKRGVKERYQPVYKGRDIDNKGGDRRQHNPYESQSLDRKDERNSRPSGDSRSKRSLPSPPNQKLDFQGHQPVGRSDNNDRPIRNFDRIDPNNRPIRSLENQPITRPATNSQDQLPQANYQTIHEVLSSNLALQRPHSLGSGQYDYISVTTTRSENGQEDEEDEFTFKYHPATGKISPLTDPPQNTTVSSSDGRIRPGEDTRFEKVFGMKIPPGPGESGTIHVNYYQKKPLQKLSVDSSSITSASELSPRSDSTASTVRHRPRNLPLSPLAREKRSHDRSHDRLHDKPAGFQRYKSNYGEGNYNSKSNEAFAKAVASIEPMVNTFNRDEWDGKCPERYDDETGEVRSMECQPALTSSARSASTTAMQVDDEYGNLNKWSRMNIPDGLNRPVSADNLNKVDQWDTHSVTTGSADTLIIKGSDPDLTSPEANESSPRTFSSIKQLKSRNYGARSFEKSQSEPNLNIGAEAYENRRSAVSQENVRQEEDTMKSSNFNALREHYEKQAKAGKDNLAKASSLPSSSLPRPASAAPKNVKNTNITLKNPEKPDVNATRNWHSNGEGPKGRAWKREREVMPEDKESNNNRNIPQSPQRYWDVYRTSKQELGPKDLLEDIDMLGNEWEREKQRQSMHNSEPKQPNYKIGTVQPLPRDTVPSAKPSHNKDTERPHGGIPKPPPPPAPPGYKNPPQYENPIPPDFQLNNRGGDSRGFEPRNASAREKVPSDWYMPQQKLSSYSTDAGSAVQQRPNTLNLGQGHEQGQGQTQGQVQG